MLRFLNATIACTRVVKATSLIIFCITCSWAGTLPPPPSHGLVLLANGQMAGWGANDFGQVQAGQAVFLNAPLRLNLPGTKAIAVTTGSRHSLAVDETGKVWAWGDNSSGQLGLGHTRPVSSPAIVTGLPGRALLVAAGEHHSAALLAGGSVWVWGANDRGQMASGTVDPFTVQAKPLQVAAIGQVNDIAAGNDFVLALVENRAPDLAGKHEKNAVSQNTVWVWGAGTTTPHAVKNLAGVVTVRAAGETAMARTAIGGYWHWRAEQMAPAIAQRQAFERLGEMSHVKLSVLKAQITAEIQAKTAAGSLGNKVTGGNASITNSGHAAAAPSSSVPWVPLLIMPAVPPVATVVQTTAVALPINAPAPVYVSAPAPAPAPSASALTRLSLSGTVRLSSGFGGNGPATSGTPMEHVKVIAEGAQCSSTDGQGRYTCLLSAGWSGRVSLMRNNYRFSPSALSFQNLRVDAGQQDFSAIYDPR